jgi:hypothetical protein
LGLLAGNGNCEIRGWEGGGEINRLDVIVKYAKGNITYRSEVLRENKENMIENNGGDRATWLQIK